MSEEKKKFKETKVGKFLKDKAPKILDTVGDVLPDKGVLGIVKNIISTDKTLTIQDKEELYRLIELDIQDIADARAREVSIVTSDSAPLINKIIGPCLAIIVISLTFILFYMVMFKKITSVEKDILIYVLGALTSYVGMVLSYYFGSSSGSKSKDTAIKEFLLK
jgi:hypothetical protein